MREDNITVLIVDDVPANRQLLAEIISKNTPYQINLASEGGMVLDSIEQNIPDIILLDIMMPNMDGYEVARVLKQKKETADIPIIFITAITDIKGISLAYEAGGVDYITKPFNKTELLARLGAHINLKIIQDDLREKNRLLADREAHLTKLVEEKTDKLERTTLALVNALENANFLNDDDTGNHIRRVSAYSALLAESYGCAPDFVKRIKLYSSLHDVGKVGIPDNLLKKPGRYTPEEFIAMQDHVVIGARMLSDPEIDPMARSIALFHHEKWDGTGYTQKLSGEDIPLEARIVTLADVYDALSFKRVYKEAFTLEQVERVITEGKGTHFDPSLVDLYFTLRDKFLEIKERYSD